MTRPAPGPRDHLPRPGRVALVAIAVLALACGAEPQAPPAWSATALDPPSDAPARFPSLAVSPGGPWLSWIETPEDRPAALRVARWTDGAWTEPATVVADDGLFVNWADFPSLAALPDGSLAAQWLVREGGASYAYAPRVARSADAGRSWSPALRPPLSSASSEYGFVSLVPAGPAAFEIVWLDGGAMTPDGGAMRLLHRRWDDGTLGAETVLDDDVCTCCQTSALLVGTTLVVAFRDHAEGEVRDISIVRRSDGRWEPSRQLHADGWVIGGCPVNGPALASDGSRLAVAWYTEADDEARVLFARSADAGASFAAPLRVDDGSPLGRVDLAWTPEGPVVSWLERSGTDGAEVRLRLIPDAGAPRDLPTPGHTVAARGSGFPRTAWVGDTLWVAWTETGPPERVRVAAISR